MKNDVSACGAGGIRTLETLQSARFQDHRKSEEQDGRNVLTTSPSEPVAFFGGAITEETAPPEAISAQFRHTPVEHVVELAETLFVVTVSAVIAFGFAALFAVLLKDARHELGAARHELASARQEIFTSKIEGLIRTRQALSIVKRCLKELETTTEACVVWIPPGEFVVTP